MDEQLRKDVNNRLKSVAGHVNGVVKMVEEDRYCIDIIKQIQAMQAALAKVSEIILDDHLHHCVTNAIQGEDPTERERVLSEVLQVFATQNKQQR